LDRTWQKGEKVSGFGATRGMFAYCRRTPIERARSLTPQTFYQRNLSGIGKPVIITDALGSWNALTKWNFEMFKSLYGSESVLVSFWSDEKHRKVVKLADYLDYLDSPSGRLPGFWIDSATKFPIEDPPELAGKPLYLTSWRALQKHPELLNDVQLSPACIDDWFTLLPQAFRNALDNATRYYSAGLLIGPAGSQAILHRDYLHSHAYLAQIRGRKQCTLFSPDDSGALYDGEIDLDHPDIGKFPLFRHATAFECTLEPGEMLFIPSEWWHHVVAIEKSITVNYNFFNRVNFRAYLTDLLQQLPAIVEGLEKTPDARADLGIDWVSRGFESINLT
jgi:histone arginine demethylase JMJD6